MRSDMQSNIPLLAKEGWMREAQTGWREAQAR